MGTELITGFEFIIPGLTAMLLTVVVAVIITKDTRKIKILLFPLYMCAAGVGFPINTIFGVILAILFVSETYAFNVLTSYVTQIRKVSQQNKWITRATKWQTDLFPASGIGMSRPVQFGLGRGKAGSGTQTFKPAGGNAQPQKNGSEGILGAINWGNRGKKKDDTNM